MDDILRFFRRFGLAAQFCQYAVLWHGICGHWGDGVGLADLLDFHPMCGYGYGRAVQFYAN